VSPRAALLGFAASAWTFWALPAGAGAFTISPLRVELSQHVTTAALTVRNEADEPVVVQAQGMHWSQADGGDALAPIQDLIVSPVAFTLPARGSQLVRVALRRPVDPATELSYRLLLQEVPRQANADHTGLEVTLRLSLPVFVQPTRAAEPQLEWSATRGEDGRLVVRAENSGAAHARIRSFTMTPVDDPQAALAQPVATYVLPGRSRQWTLGAAEPNDSGSAAAAGRYQLQGTTERGEVVAELTVAP
jgi:fimbrial chaperone protein